MQAITMNGGITISDTCIGCGLCATKCPKDAIVMDEITPMKDQIQDYFWGLDLRLDANQRVAVEIIGTAKRTDRSLSRVEPFPWDAIGGQDEAVQAIRDSIELTMLHAHLFAVGTGAVGNIQQVGAAIC